MVDGLVLSAVAVPYIIMGKGKEVESGPCTLYKVDSIMDWNRERRRRWMDSNKKSGQAVTIKYWCIDCTLMTKRGTLFQIAMDICINPFRRHHIIILCACVYITAYKTILRKSRWSLSSSSYVYTYTIRWLLAKRKILPWKTMKFLNPFCVERYDRQ